MALLTKERILFRPKQFLLREETLEGLEVFLSLFPSSRPHSPPPPPCRSLLLSVEIIREIERARVTENLTSA